MIPVPPQPEDPTPGRARPFALILCVAFFVAGLAGIVHHELWRDELQPWLIARASHSLPDLLRNKRYEGHPAFWYLLVYGIARLTRNPFAMQLLHLGIATGTTYVVARYAPFSKLQRALLCFGYFPLYEYGTISRNYALGVLFLFCFCAAFRAGPAKNYLLLAALLGLLCQSSIYGVMIAMALVLALVLEALVSPKRQEFFMPRKTHILAAALLFAAMLAISVVQMIPPEDSGFAMGWHWSLTQERLETTVDVVWRAFVPIFKSLPQFWNSNILDGKADGMLFGSLFVLAGTLLLLAPNPVPFVAYVIGAAGILTFTHVKYYGYLRHHGHLFVLFIACLWLVVGHPDRRLSLPLFGDITKSFARLRPLILTSLLLLHTAAAGVASAIDWRVPFSQGKATADFLRAKGMADWFIVGDMDYSVSTVAGYLDRKIFYVRGHRMGSFIVWDRARLEPAQDLLQVAKHIAAERGQDVLAISNVRREIVDSSAVEIAHFDGSIVADENYYIYLVKCRVAAPGLHVRAASRCQVAQRLPMPCSLP